MATYWKARGRHQALFDRPSADKTGLLAVARIIYALFHGSGLDTAPAIAHAGGLPTAYCLPSDAPAEVKCFLCAFEEECRSTFDFVDAVMSGDCDAEESDFRRFDAEEIERFMDSVLVYSRSLCNHDHT